MASMPDKKISPEERRTNRHILRYVPEWMELRGITQRKMAEALSVSEAAVSKWINGKTPVTTKKLLDMAILLDASVVDILQSPHERVTQRQHHEIIEIFATMSKADQDIYLALGHSLARHAPMRKSAE